MNKSRQEVLLKEYEICQQHNNSIGSQMWVSTSIFISTNVALLGWLAKSIGSVENLNRLVLLTVPVLGIGLILILWYWIRWVDRMRFLTRVNYERMRDIEYELGMQKNWMVRGLDVAHEKDKKGELENKEKEQFREAKQYYRRYTPARGFGGVRRMAIILIILWSIFIISWVASLFVLNC